MPATVRPRLPRPDDPDILQRVCDAIRKGHPIQTAGRMAGIGHTTAWDWLRQGEAMLSEHPGVDPRELGSHAVYADAVKQAEAEFVDRNLDYVMGACGPDAKGWIPAMTLLERRRPQDFGRRDRLEVDQRSVSVSVTIQADTLEAAESVLSRLQERERTRLLPPPAG